MLAETYLKQGRDAEALAAARAALQLEPLGPYGNYALGLIFFELGQNEEATEVFRKIKTEDSRLQNYKYYLAFIEKRRGHFAEAATLIRPLADAFPERMEYQWLYASVLSDARLFANAGAVYTRMLAKRPSDWRLLALLASTYSGQGLIAKAIPLMEEANRLHPTESTVVDSLNVYRNRLDAQAHIPVLLKQIEETPRDVTRLVDTLEVLAFSAREAEAEQLIKRVYALDPSDPEIYVTIGVTLGDMGKPDAAIDAYKRSLSKKDNPAAQFNLALVYQKRDQFDLASAAYQRGIELKPDTPGFIEMYGELLLNNGKRAEALAMFKRSLSMSPLDPGALFYAGVLSSKLGDLEGAKGYLNTLINVDTIQAKKLARWIALAIKP
jgi:tetratricopeptide (TPR) repeat protein